VPWRRAASPAALAAGVLALSPWPASAGDPETGPVSATALCGTGPIEILVTNDDGFDAAGVRALAAGLAAAGHRVTIVAPEDNASGSAMSFTWGTVRVTRRQEVPATYAVAGSPATAVVVGATALYPAGHRPDLVVSGINHGPNNGSVLMLSGTVGAALAGTLLLDPPVPGIALSAARLHPAEPVDSAANRTQFVAIGRHAANLVSATRGWFCEDGRVVRARTVLNVNYPARPVNELRGTVAARQGAALDFHIAFTPTSDGQYESHVSRSDAADARDTDNHWLDQGYVTVTPITGAIDDEASLRTDLGRRLGEL